MAYPYNVYYPQNYPQNYSQMPQQTSQIQNGGFISVRSEDEARNYPVAPGNSVTFKNETAPYIYTKTMGFSQLDRPMFDKFRLVKEEQNAQNDILTDTADNLPQYVLKPEFDEIRAQINALQEEVQILKETKKPQTKKKEEAEG